MGKSNDSTRKAASSTHQNQGADTEFSNEALPPMTSCSDPTLLPPPERNDATTSHREGGQPREDTAMIGRNEGVFSYPAMNTSVLASSSSSVETLKALNSAKTPLRTATSSNALSTAALVTPSTPTSSALPAYSSTIAHPASTSNQTSSPNPRPKFIHIPGETKEEKTELIRRGGAAFSRSIRSGQQRTHRSGVPPFPLRTIAHDTLVDRAWLYSVQRLEATRAYSDVVIEAMVVPSPRPKIPVMPPQPRMPRKSTQLEKKPTPRVVPVSDVKYNTFGAGEDGTQGHQFVDGSATPAVGRNAEPLILPDKGKGVSRGEDAGESRVDSGPPSHSLTFNLTTPTGEGREKGKKRARDPEDDDSLAGAQHGQARPRLKN
ncbi:hypothetical protein SCP_0803510 [Sparassis crispa]|uniref:Uncharacterized protein n=1 Tax=Sparassis crispa TaxID=139825 RepID=A0A401GUG9_9APHY|nr:hypothetical protein SCP_0803510 [Sparassis crispa]GBE85829.1 hypothetical protein SCP_0803510 [Sparassis crispa]